MKKIALLVVVIIVACITILSCENQNTKSKLTPSINVIGVENHKLKPNVNAEEFEIFISEKLAPMFNKIEGQTFHLMKGDKGAHIGEYAFVYLYESVEARNSIYPPDGGISEELMEIFESPEALLIWEELGTFLEKTEKNSTDYVRIY
jgi:hypothetical protein